MNDLQLGLDTELVVATPRGTLWPHTVGISQKRLSTDQIFDWHGDGFAWELCVAPAASPVGVIQNVARGLINLYDSFNIRKAMGPSIYMVPIKIMKEAPSEVRRLGCAPSFNVYGQQASPKGLGLTKRTTGCHFHVSSDAINKKTYRDIVMWADVLVGSTWASVSPEPIVDERLRRRYYGRAGEHRVRFYNDAKTLFGVEYRTLPGCVLHHPAYLGAMLECMQHAATRALDSGPPPASLIKEAVRVVNTADRKNKLVKSINLPSSVLESLDYACNTRARLVDIDAWKGLC